MRSYLRRVANAIANELGYVPRSNYQMILTGLRQQIEGRARDRDYLLKQYHDVRAALHRYTPGDQS